MSKIGVNQNFDKLPKDAQDIIQAIFTDNIPVSCGIPSDCVEVKLDNPVYNIMEGDGTIHFHALGNTEYYLHSRGDNDWAIVFRAKNIGNAERGRKLIHDYVVSPEPKFLG
jgi:hypothetical protein